MIIKHYYYFGNNVASKMEGGGKRLNKDNWDLLRNQGESDDFALEGTIKEYENMCEKSDFHRGLASLVCDTAKSLRWNEEKIVSFGVGKAVLEWHIKKEMPDRKIVLTDYTTESIEKLKKLFSAADRVCEFDMLKDDYKMIAHGCIALLNRVSTEFSRDQWSGIISKLYHSGINKIILIPAEVATVGRAIKELTKHVLNTLLGRKDTFCGYLYSESALLKLFNGNGEKKDYYHLIKEINYRGTCVYYLERIMEGDDS